jgi:5'-3' exonuclease
MGINGLTKFLKAKAPSCIQKVSYEQLKGVYAVDVSSFLFASQYNKFAKGLGNHIREFFEMIVCSHKYGYLIVPVFDGDTHGIAKADTIDDRLNTKTKQIVKITTLMTNLNLPVSNTEQDIIESCRVYFSSNTDFSPMKLELQTALKNHIVLNSSHFSDLKTLFDLAGQPYLQAKGEADHMIAKLATEKLIDGVFSEDLDMLTHGIPKLIRGLGSARSTGELNVFTLQDALKELNLNQSQFIELCILCGCDYANKIEGIGPVKGHNLLIQYGSIINIIDAIDSGKLKYIVPEAFRTKWKIAMDQFTISCESLPDTVIYWHPANIQLQQWLLDNTNYTQLTLVNKLSLLPKAEIMHVPSII